MTVEIKPLPYALTAFEPYISEKTFSFHYGKHYKTYVNNTLELIKGTSLEGKDLKEIILTAASDDIYQSLFNNAAQSFNHEFFWNSLTNDPQKKVVPEVLMEKIEADFASLDNLKEALKKAALSQFGSGWVWLVEEDGHLKVVALSNAGTPIVRQNQKPLLCIDVWEHAYYLDYQNARAGFVDAILNHLINWQFAADNLTGE